MSERALNAAAQEMSNMSNESEDRMVVNDFVNSPSTDEVTSGGNISGGGSLKKGPWTSAEDAILVEYVNKHGEGNWNAVQKHSGLSRCGKSCRLRWANHLRPDLKKGAFTPDEERHIIELHAKMGNKWARMASELPGRTDNEIKNFWNTRIKRRQRAGLPIYPPDICLQSLDENSPSQNMGLFSSGETLNSELLLANNLEIPSVKFENYELNQHLHQSLLDIHGSNLLSGGPNCTCSNSFRFSTMHPAKRLRESEPSLLRESEPSLPGVTAVVSDVHTAAVNQYMDDSCLTTKSFGATRSHDLSSSQCLLSGSHAFTNGNSSSKPVPWAMKLELPSLQYSDTQMGRSWVTPSPLPSLESVDTLIQTPRRERAESACFSPQNNGLLESILYESRALKKSKKHSSQQTLDTCTGLENSAESLAQLHEADWDVYGDPNSPLGRSITSVFSDCAPPASGSLLDEQQLMKTLPGENCLFAVKQEVVDWDSATHNEGNDGNSCQINFSRPDYLLDSNWFGLGNEHGKDYFILRDAIGSLLTEDFSCELQVDS